jgi:hypothetical protein
MFMIRTVREEDKPFIYNSWLKSVRKDFNDVRTSQYFQTYTDHINQLLKTSEVLIACDPEDPNHVFGYIVFKWIGDVFVLHWGYVKNVNRKLGIFKKLLGTQIKKIGEEPFVTTYKNDRQAKGLMEKYKMVYKPELRGAA